MANEIFSSLTCRMKRTMPQPPLPIPMTLIKFSWTEEFIGEEKHCYPLACFEFYIFPFLFANKQIGYAKTFHNNHIIFINLHESCITFIFILIRISSFISIFATDMKRFRYIFAVILSDNHICRGRSFCYWLLLRCMRNAQNCCSNGCPKCRKSSTVR